jgi:hypothetical protein
MEEIWAPIDGYPNYEVSSLGRIKSLPKQIDHKQYIEYAKERIITEKRHTSGYLSVSLSHNGKKKQFLIHRLVAAAFLVKEPSHTQVNHKNGIRTDNRVDNLEWVTVSENHRHSFRVLGREHPRTMLGRKGANNPSSVKVVCSTLGMTFDSVKETAQALGIGERRLSDVLNDKAIHVRGLHFRRLHTVG